MVLRASHWSSRFEKKKIEINRSGFFEDEGNRFRVNVYKSWVETSVKLRAQYSIIKIWSFFKVSRFTTLDGIRALSSK
jgi:hypothetical protein